MFKRLFSNERTLEKIVYLPPLKTTYLNSNNALHFLSILIDLRVENIKIGIRNYSMTYWDKLDITTCIAEEKKSVLLNNIELNLEADTHDIDFQWKDEVTFMLSIYNKRIAGIVGVILIGKIPINKKPLLISSSKANKAD
ncbi:hypothetical protein ACFFHM_08380 [Halalkalibacter kiskunsagensis]|uniref:Uncharacterized protein n=1 Tax=Halalkalibacter kiskunsagensis TaxID=1548599 RepID=A0ABV6KB21_9BACI